PARKDRLSGRGEATLRFGEGYDPVADCTEVNAVFRLLPMAVTAVMMTTAIRAAMRPYSIAAAPDSSRAKRSPSLDIGTLQLARGTGRHAAGDRLALKTSPI